MRVLVPGVVTITGPRGAFTKRGVVVVRRTRTRVNRGRGVRLAGTGVDVSLRRTRLRKPLTLTYRVGRVPRGHVARAMHVADNGEWEVKPARRVGRRGLRIRTKSFSKLVPAWLNTKQWASNLKQWGSNTAGWVASGVGGRTPPLSNCGPPAPAWFSYDKRSDLVHVCSIDNGGRAEIQIKSNRGLSQLVRIPGNPAYVYIENLPGWLRRMQPWDTNKEVVLGPGQRMTVGYDRPASDVAGQFVINPYAARAQLDNIVRSVLDLIAGIEAIPATALVAYAWTQCATDLQLSLSEAPVDPEVTLGKAGCMITSLRKLAEDTDRALQIIAALGGNKGEADALFRQADRLIKAVKAFGVFEQVKSHAVASVDESLRALVKNGNDTIGISITAADPHVRTIGFPGEFPQGIAVSDEGDLWVTLGDSVARIPRSGPVSTLTASGSENSLGEIVQGSDGAMWSAGFLQIARISGTGSFTQYTNFSGPNQDSRIGLPEALTRGPDGAIWFTDESVFSTISRIDRNGDITRFNRDPEADPNLAGIAAGPDGALWFTDDDDQDAISRMTLGGTFSRYPLASAGSDPNNITVGPDGALWFTERGAARIGRITTDGSITEFPLPASTDGFGPFDLTAGPGGVLWFTQDARIGRMTTSGQVTMFDVPGAKALGEITVRDDALWVTDGEGSAVHQLRPPP